MTGPKWLDSNLPICSSGKRPFRTEQVALAAVKRNAGEDYERDGYRPGRVESGVYECKVCNFWHLTAAPRSSGRAPRRDGNRKRRYR